MTRTGLSPEQLVQTAMEHCIFPLAQMEEVRAKGPTIFVEAEGAHVTDVRGRTYLDMMGTHTRANSLGYGNQEIAQAIYEQLATLHYVGTADNLSEPVIELSAKIASLAPGDLSRVTYVSGGSEAVETAIKIARQYHLNAGRKPRAYKIISRWNAYHGATMGALAATDWLGTRHVSEPGMTGYSFIPAPTHYRNPFGMDDAAYEGFCADYLEQQILHEGPELVAAFIAEPIMQQHGVQMPSPAYFKRVREICTKYDVLLIADEVITGFGRTGAWFASYHLDLEPDIMTMAKALTAGYMPMGGVITTAAIADAMPVFRHVHTFSGHAAAAAAALTVIGIKERDGLVDKAKRDGEYLHAALREALIDKPIVGDVRGIGMWHAVDFTGDKESREPLPVDRTKAIVGKMREKGVIVSAIGTTAFEMAPPLICTRPDFDRTVQVAAEAIDEVAAEMGLA
ncbi:MAG: aspartate aminotransferase family protein [Thermomicrobiales bacterium]|nr:aspartate aminotransferase family protein [Thermomicrobiales bacterium]